MKLLIGLCDFTLHSQHSFKLVDLLIYFLCQSVCLNCGRIIHSCKATISLFLKIVCLKRLGLLVDLIDFVLCFRNLCLDLL
ncbi:hypothetical protein D3C81_1580300 [compost metagenome]